MAVWTSRHIERVRILTILEAMRRAGRGAFVLPSGYDGWQVVTQTPQSAADRRAAGLCRTAGCGEPRAPG